MRFHIVAGRWLIGILAALACWQPLAAVEATTDSVVNEAVPVVVWNRQIAVFRQGWNGLTVKERAAKAAARISAISDEAMLKEVVVQPTTVDDTSGCLLFVDGNLLLGLSRADLQADEHTDIMAYAQASASAIQEVFKARLEQKKPQILIRGILWSLVFTLVLVVVLVLLSLLRRRLQRRIDHLSWAAKPVYGFDASAIVRSLAKMAIRVPIFVLGAAAVYLWVTSVLGLFPYTSPWSATLGGWFVDRMHEFGHAIIVSLPSIGMIALIIFCTRMAAKALDVLFENVQEGRIVIQWMEPQTARATRRIVGILIWLFALTLAYPYVPGSSSEAFKGVSVFAGLLLTLGASGMVNQVMSGLVVVYSRTMRVGDLIRVGEVTGMVTELGFLSTKVRTPVGNEVSIPNGNLVTAVVQNYSIFDPAIGPRIFTTVTIGYDTPWRQVHSLLITAAQRTPGIDPATPPEVVQRALSDFYVEYELRCRIYDPMLRNQVLSELHGHIQDAFNEQGVQIMSPHFEMQPNAPVLAAPGKWAAPAAPPQSG